MKTEVTDPKLRASGLPGVVHAPVAHTTKSGVSLVIVLGILVLISLIILAFVRTTHDARDTAQLARERLRSDHLLDAAVGRAMEDVNNRLAGRPFDWDLPTGDTAVDFNTLVSRNGTSTNDGIPLATTNVLAEIPSCLTNEVRSMAEAAQWIDFGSSPRGRYAFMVVNLSGFLDANVVGGMPSSDRASPAELDFSPIFSDTNTFFTDRTDHRPYETRSELLRLNGATNIYDDVFAVYSYEPAPESYFTNTTRMGTRPFTNDLVKRTPIWTDYAAGTSSCTNLVNILTSCGVSNSEFVATCIIDYQDSDRFLSTNWIAPTNANWVTEAVPLLNEVNVTTNSSGTNLLTVDLEFWYPFFPPPDTNEEFRIRLSDDNGVMPETNFPIVSFNIDDFTTHSLQVTTSPGSTFTLNVHVEWRSLFPATPWKLIQTYKIPAITNRNYSLNDPRQILISNTNATIGSMNANCFPFNPGCQGLPIYHPNRPMQNIGELGYIPVSTNSPWQTLDLTQTNIAALLDRFTARSAPSAPRHGLVSAGTTNLTVWEVLFRSIPIGHASNTLSYAGFTTTTDDDAPTDVFPLALFMSKNNIYFDAYSNFLPMIADTPTYVDFLTNATSFFSNGTNVPPDLREDLLRGIVEMISFRHQLYLVVVAAESLAVDGNTPTASRRGMALVWRDGYTGQYFIRNFRRITD